MPLINYYLEKSTIFFVLFMFLSCLSCGVLASNFRKNNDINKLVNSCFQDAKYCQDALFIINNYQKSVAKDKKFICQTRLLGLEANLIMAMNSNFKKNDVKSIIDSVKKYC